jgi:hypothetical protein
MENIKTVTMKRKADGVVRTFNAEDVKASAKAKDGAFEGWAETTADAAEGAPLMDGDAAPKPAKKKGETSPSRRPKGPGQPCSICVSPP